MKNVIKFIVWYLLMWLLTIPAGWYFIRFLNFGFELTQIFILVTSLLVYLGLIVSEEFRFALGKHLSFFYKILNRFEELYEKKKFNKMKGKDYVYVKIRN